MTPEQEGHFRKPTAIADPPNCYSTTVTMTALSRAPICAGAFPTKPKAFEELGPVGNARMLPSTRWHLVAYSARIAIVDEKIQERISESLLSVPDILFRAIGGPSSCWVIKLRKRPAK